MNFDLKDVKKFLFLEDKNYRKQLKSDIKRELRNEEIRSLFNLKV